MCIYICYVYLALLISFTVADINPDVGLRVPNLVSKYDYPLETHTVITSDKYILTMHRIPYEILKKDGKKPIVFLMHGMLGSSADWVLMGPENGLGFLLADNGYDVWMGNARGNYYSRKHMYLDPDVNRSAFWNFSHHEIGVYDLPSMIDYILLKTGDDKISFICHSEGCTAFFVMGSILPSYNFKIKVMIALAPIVYSEYIPNYVAKPFWEFVGKGTLATQIIGSYEFLPSTIFKQILAQVFCNSESTFQEVCENILYLFARSPTNQLNRTTLPVIFSNVPAGASTKQLLHYGQGVISGKFKQYDYGIDNFKKYGQFFPPDYNLGYVTAPVVLIYANNDLLTSEKDINRLEREITNPVKKIKVNNEKFNHLDFLWAKDVVTLLYKQIYVLLKLNY